METTLRQATPADASWMARIAEQAYATYLERLNGQRPAPMDANYGALASGAEAWVAEVRGEVVGFLILVPETDSMLVENVAVLPSHKGLGVGGLTLALAESQAVSAGRNRITLYTNVAMVENQRLYEKMGYRETHRTVENGFGRVFYAKSF